MEMGFVAYCSPWSKYYKTLETLSDVCYVTSYFAIQSVSTRDKLKKNNSKSLYEALVVYTSLQMVLQCILRPSPIHCMTINEFESGKWYDVRVYGLFV